MIINSTAKTSANDYFDNTQNFAIVHLRRTFDATDQEQGNDIPFELVVENIGTIIDFMIQVEKPDGEIIRNLPLVSFSGNTFTFTPDIAHGHDEIVVDGAIVNILIVATR